MLKLTSKVWDLRDTHTFYWLLSKGGLEGHPHILLALIEGRNTAMRLSGCSSWLGGHCVNRQWRPDCFTSPFREFFSHLLRLPNVTLRGEIPTFAASGRLAAEPRTMVEPAVRRRQVLRRQRVQPTGAEVTEMSPNEEIAHRWCLSASARLARATRTPPTTHGQKAQSALEKSDRVVAAMEAR